MFIGRTNGVADVRHNEKLDLSPLYSLLNFLEINPFSHSSLFKEASHDIVLLTAFLIDPPQHFVEDGTLEELIIMASEVGSINSSFDYKSMDLDIARRLNKLLPHIHSRMRNLMIAVILNLRGNDFHPSGIYPGTGQFWFVKHLVGNLKELLVKSKADSIRPLKFYIMKLKMELEDLCARLVMMPEQQKQEAHVKDLMERIMDSAYEVEYVIDSFIVTNIPIWYCMLFLRNIIRKLNQHTRQLKIESGDVQSIVSSILDSTSSEPNKLQITPILNSSDINEKLNEIFNHPDIINSFEFRTRSVVSSYEERKNEVFLQLLHNAKYGRNVEYPHNTAYTSSLSQFELEASVFEFLMGRSYFIILEDVEDFDTFTAIDRVLPDQEIGSRRKILLTTRSPEFADQCSYNFQEYLYNTISEDNTSTSQTTKPATHDDVVGFKEETKTMLDLLMRGSTKLQLISIYGMPGLGKTTLAKKLYNDLSVVNHFHARAWCNVSQVYQIEELLLELLGHFLHLSDAILRENDEHQLADLLRKSLKGRRFLIVLDDLWSIEAWNALRRCFPDDNNESRIIFTTRLQQLASQAQSGSILQILGHLSDNESWELLSKKLFEKETCPQELFGAGTQIVKRCKGLPIAVVLIAGVLAKMEKTKDRWTQILESLNSSILGDTESHAQYILQLSYVHLPDHLKPCFLYFGEFLEDREVQVSKLIRLWIAEGFIQQAELKSLEDVAEDCLMDLIGRSLVTISQEKFKGRVKSCRVHDLIHEFCLTKGREENFLQQICGYNEHFPSSDNYQDYGVDPNYFNSSAPIIYDTRRIYIYSKRNHFIMLKPSGPQVRSLMFLPASDTCPTYPYDISFISHNFKLLKILNLEEINIGDSFKAIDVLVLLRYLAVQADVDRIPSSVANLCNLETFLFKGLRAKVVKAPDAIWDMMKLRHMHINGSASFELDPSRPDNSSILENLQTFSAPILTCGGDTEKIMRRLRGIKKLKCIFLDSWDGATNCNKFPELGFLSQLVSLKVLYDGVSKYPCEFNFPSNLKKLTLSNFRMPWDQISQLAKLCNLEVLKLLSNAFEGDRWEMEDEVFPELKLLKLDTLDVVEWTATGDHFPRLQHLILNKCEQLEKIPPGIGDIATLDMIEVMWCKHSAAISAREIHEEQLDYGNEALNVHVHPEVLDA